MELPSKDALCLWWVRRLHGRVAQAFEYFSCQPKRLTRIAALESFGCVVICIIAFDAQ